MASDEFDTLQLAHAGTGIRLLTLNLPSVRNAMTEQMTSAWSQAMAELRADDSVRVLVVTGAGTSFCSGADLSWLDQGGGSLQSSAPKIRERMLAFYETWLAARELPFPVLAAVNGPAVGAGLCVVLACDLRYAHPDAHFSAPFIHLGTHGGMGVTSLLPQAVGMTRAREMLYTGREVDASEALSWGLISGIAEDVVAHTLKVAERIAGAAPIAATLTKAGLKQTDLSFATSLQWEGLAQPVTMASSDLHEGIRARRENRPPRFTGS
jgi:enoyl-CoA hydratase